jgi:hypothetical protein
VDIRRALIGGLGQSFGSSIGGHCMQNTHTGGHESQKMRPVWVKRGLYWRITRFRAPGEYMMRLDRLNKYSLLQHMGGGVYAHGCTHGGGPRPHLILQ